jgi:hypothetical protein
MVERGEVSVPARPSNAEPVKLTGAGECLINLPRCSLRCHASRRASRDYSVQAGAAALRATYSP